jgi:hypothetical protein
MSPSTTDKDRIETLTHQRDLLVREIEDLLVIGKVVPEGAKLSALGLLHASKKLKTLLAGTLVQKALDQTEILQGWEGVQKPCRHSTNPRSFCGDPSCPDCG